MITLQPIVSMTFADFCCIGRTILGLEDADVRINYLEIPRELRYGVFAAHDCPSVLRRLVRQMRSAIINHSQLNKAVV